MTGFGTATDAFDDTTVTIEIKSINHRYLDINFRIPKFLSLLEKNFRDIIREEISRGKINLSVNFEKIGKLYSDITVDVDLAEHYFKGLELISKKLRIPNEINTVDFINMKGVFDLKERDIDLDFQIFIENLLKKAIDNLKLMKEDEGKFLENDILKRIDKLENYILQIDKLKEQIIDKYREKLEKNIEKIFGEQRELINEKRIEFEIVQFSDRSDITEEIVRFKSHINKFLKTVSLSPPVGKKLDFILQEMNREVNTIGSKNILPEISNIVIEAKTEIEKIREQIQNIE